MKQEKESEVPVILEVDTLNITPNNPVPAKTTQRIYCIDAAQALNMFYALQIGSNVVRGFLIPSLSQKKVKIK